MVKFFLILLLMISTLSADEKEDNIYEANCIKCHSKLPAECAEFVVPNEGVPYSHFVSVSNAVWYQFPSLRLKSSK